MISVFGLGMAGLPLAAIISEVGLKVIGIDLDFEKCNKINRGENPIPGEPHLDELIKKHGGKNLIASINYEDAKKCKVFIIVVPLFIDSNNAPNFVYLEKAAKDIGKILKKDDLVILETTVPPLTTETKIKKWLEDQSNLKMGEFLLAHSPERITAGLTISRLKEFPKIVGGVDKKSTDEAYKFYNKFIPNLSKVTSSRIAEFIKVIEGCYRDTNIALANELYKISQEYAIDFNEARKYANHRYCDIHYPSTGVGGHCIPYYPWFLIKEMEKKGKFSISRLLRNSREINEEMVNYWACRIIHECFKINKPISQIKICINGLTFREGVKGTYNSKNIQLAKLLEKKGLNCFGFDHLLSKKEIENLDVKFINPKEADLVFNTFKLNFE